MDKKFPKSYKDELEHFMDLVEEVGELSQALMIASGRKVTTVDSKKRTHEDVVDALCDVQFQLIRIAHHLGVDLHEEYPKVLDQIERRIAAGEFDLQK